MTDHEIELIDYIRVIWRQKWIILATVVAALLAVWGASDFTESYQTERNLLIVEPAISETEPGASELRLGSRTYQEIATSSMVMETIRSADAGDFDLETVNLRNIISVSVESLAEGTGSGPQYLVSAKLRHPNPELLASLSTSWSEAFSSSVVQLFRDHTATALAQLESRYAQAESDLEKAIFERSDYLSQSAFDALQVRRNDLRGERQATHGQLSAVQRETRLLEEYLGSGLMGLSENGNSGQIVMGEHLSVTSLMSALILGLPLAEFGDMLVQRAADLTSEIALIETELSSIDAEVDRISPKLSQYDREISALEESATSLAAEIQAARGLQDSENIQIVELTSQSIPEVSSKSRRLMMDFLVAGFLGALTGVLLAFFVDYLVQVRMRERSQAAKHEKTPVSKVAIDNSDESANKDEE